MTEEEHNEDEVVYEVRGRGDRWKVFYPDEGDMATSFPVYDKEGKMKSLIWAGGKSGRLTESFQDFPTAREAMRYAKDVLGAEKIKLIKTKERKPKKEPNA